MVFCVGIDRIGTDDKSGRQIITRWLINELKDWPCSIYKHNLTVEFENVLPGEWPVYLYGSSVFRMKKGGAIIVTRIQ